MAFFEFKKTDVIQSRFIANPSYNFSMSLNPAGQYASERIYLFASASYGRTRSWTDVNGMAQTGSYNLSGSILFVDDADITDQEKKSINRLRNIYASGTFQKPWSYTSSSVWNSSNPTNQFLRMVNIPSILYGSEVRPGTFSISVGNNQYRDDGYGGLYTGSSLVGFVLYQHGIACFGQTVSAEPFTNTILNFSGTSKVPVNIYICRAPKASVNFSNNNSYTQALSGAFSGSNVTSEITTSQPKTFITTVGLYDENYQLVGVAKVSSPILNEEDVSVSFRLKLAF